MTCLCIQGSRPGKSKNFEARQFPHPANTGRVILEMTALDSGQGRSSWQVLALSSLIHDVITRFQDTAKESCLQLEMSAIPEDIPSVSGDASRLSQALDEIVQNALQFSPIGGQVTISAEISENRPHPWVKVSVQDTGPGIPEDEQDKVFDRFFRGRLAESGHIPGTGLGLSVAQEILRIHGGQLTVQSSGVPGEGSTFTLWLPASPAN